MSTDPASLEVSLSIDGLDRFELNMVLDAMPIGKSIHLEKKDGIIGPPRHDVLFTELNIAQAHDILDSTMKAIKDRQREWEARTVEEGKAP